jgi:hypothetical protein
MGRTNPTYRDWLRAFEERYGAYRRGLRRRDQPAFDRLFAQAADHADAAGLANDTDPEVAALLSMLLAHERRIAELEGDDDQ